MRIHSRLTLILLTLMLMLPLQAQAQNQPQPQRIAVLDWQAALMETTKVREAMQEADSQLSGDQTRARQLAEEGRSLQERLQRDGSVMSEDERRRLTQQVEQKLQEYQFVLGRLQQQQQELRQEVVSRFRPSLEQAVNELLEERNIDILLDRQAVAFAKPEFDLTEAVAEKLNKAK